MRSPGPATIISLCALVGCSSSGGRPGIDGRAIECVGDISEPPYTPGVVECGDGTCAAGDCYSCFDPDSSPTGYRAYCVTDGWPSGVECRHNRGCDGPEDCAPGEFCWEFESSECTTDEWPQPGHRLCPEGMPCTRCP